MINFAGFRPSGAGVDRGGADGGRGDGRGAGLAGAGPAREGGGASVCDGSTRPFQWLDPRPSEKMMNFALKMMDFSFKMMKFAFKMMPTTI